MKKKILSILLTFSMVLSFFPGMTMTANAEGEAVAKWVTVGADDGEPEDGDYGELGTLIDAFGAANTAAEGKVTYVQLTGSVTVASGALVLNEGKSMVLDLKGNKITVTSSGNVWVIQTYGASNLTLKNGFIDAIATGSSNTVEAIQASGDLTLENMNIEASGNGTVYAVKTTASCNVTVQGGSIKATTTSTRSDAYGIYDSNAATLNVDDVDIKVNSNEDAYGICGSRLNLSGGSIIVNGKGYIFGIKLESNSDGPATIDSCPITVTNEKDGTSSCSYGIQVVLKESRNVEIRDCKITVTGTKNTGKSYGIYGRGAVKVSGKTEITVADQLAYGIHVGYSGTSSMSLIGNEVSISGETADVYLLNATSKLYATDGTTPYAGGNVEVLVGYEPDLTDDVDDVIVYEVNDDNADKFSLTGDLAANYCLERRENNLVLVADGNGNQVTTWKWSELIAENSAALAATVKPGDIIVNDVPDPDNYSQYAVAFTFADRNYDDRIYLGYEEEWVVPSEYVVTVYLDNNETAEYTITSDSWSWMKDDEGDLILVKTSDAKYIQLIDVEIEQNANEKFTVSFTPEAGYTYLYIPQNDLFEYGENADEMLAMLEEGNAMIAAQRQTADGLPEEMAELVVTGGSFEVASSMMGLLVKMQKVTDVVDKTNNHLMVGAAYVITGRVERDVTVAATENGTVTASAARAKELDTVTLTVTPAAGYQLASLTVVDAEGNTVPVEDGHFTMPRSAVTVTAEFIVVTTHTLTGNGKYFGGLDDNATQGDLDTDGYHYSSDGDERILSFQDVTVSYEKWPWGIADDNAVHIYIYDTVIFRPGEGLDGICVVIGNRDSVPVQIIGMTENAKLIIEADGKGIHAAKTFMGDEPGASLHFKNIDVEINSGDAGVFTNFNVTVDEYASMSIMPGSDCDAIITAGLICDEARIVNGTKDGTNWKQTNAAEPFVINKVTPPAHEHSYTYTGNGDGTHNGSCACGKDAITNEACTYVDGVCSKCGYVKPVVPGTYDVTVTVKENKADGTQELCDDATLTLIDLNGKMWIKDQSVGNGVYTFENVPNGTYNLEIKNKNSDKIKTILVTVEDGNINLGMVELPAMTINSKVDVAVDVEGDSPITGAAVGGLDKLADAIAGDIKQEADTEISIDVTMNIEAKMSEKVDDEHKEKIEEIAQSQSENLTFLDITIAKTTTTKQTGKPDSVQTDPINDTEILLEIVIPFDTANRREFAVYRYHELDGSMVQKLTADKNADGEYIVVGDGVITMYVRYFSTYAVGYSEGNETPDESTKYTVKFQTNGGTGTMDDVTVAENTMYTLPACGFTAPAGKQFKAWNVNGTEYAVGAEILITGDVTIKAVWQDIPAPPVIPSVPSVPATPSYSVNVSGVQGGTITVNLKNAAAGTTVIVTVTPDDGFELDELIIRDANGKMIEWKTVGENEYAFVMPAGKVTVSAVFRAVDTGCPKDATCPIWSFQDAKTTAWYHDGVHYCVENGLMNGMSVDMFAPNGTTTRAQIVTILWRLEGQPVADYAMSFTDVAAGQWYTEAIRWAASEGIVLGHSDTEFAPNVAITREQMAAILYRYCQYKKIDVSVGEETNILSYNDAFDVHSWAMAAMQWACGAGVIGGMTDGDGMKLDPTGTATRAQAATMLWRFCEEII